MLTGMRPGEVCNLRPMDIDRSSDVWEYRPGSHKTEHHGRSRTVYLGPQAKEILAKYLFREPSEHCFSPSESRQWFRDQATQARKTPKSCGNRVGKRSKPVKKSANSRKPRQFFDSSSYGQAIQYACAKAWPAPAAVKSDATQLKPWIQSHRWAPNQIRHTQATAIRKQFGLEAAQVILGHASADVTQIYAERDAEKARDIIRQIG
jgi:integrase